MKKVIAFLLVAVMCLSFAACGKKKSEAVEKKSEAVENVELLIADLPGLTMENYDEIIAAKKKLILLKQNTTL